MQRANWRATLLTPTLLRIETSRISLWVDGPTQVVVQREWKPVEHTASSHGGRTDLDTGEAVFRISSKGRVSVRLKGQATFHRVTARGNLGGTRRTLDNTFGPVNLGKGLMSRRGLAVLDDSHSLLLGAGGELNPRQDGGRDQYFFAYGQRFRDALQDFYRLTGSVPLLPRFALGNWWSRYRAYTQTEYLDLMKRFAAEKIPLSVATVDMDWHWVDIAAQFPGHQDNGWTGYSWNTKLFPDWKGFLAELKAMGLRVTLNLHPADGVRSYEDAYPAMARSLGRDPATGETLEFDFADPRFRQAYFEHLHHPLEDAGVDFWWIDWQQGRRSKLRGLDPLWALNHYHYADNARNGKTPLILSRFAGPGSHRYPLGFSGDTFINWKVLDFQPRFTATATNIGYVWWSHDIGGHMFGYRNEELYLRWLQLGVFSPILRLHSTSQELLGKEPWRFRFDVAELAAEALRLRHKLLPYLQTQNHRAHRGAALVEPLYYAWPEDTNAYRHKNQFLFGSELLVCPITRPVDGAVALASTEAWIPPGRWTDVFTGQCYEGPQLTTLTRDLRSLPVLAKAGAVLPMADEGGRLEVSVWRGDSSYRLEDEATVDFTVSDQGTSLRLKIEGNSSMTVRFPELAWASVKAFSGGVEVPVTWRNSPVAVELTVTTELELVVTDTISVKKPDRHDRLVDVLSRWQARNGRKNRLYKRLESVDDSGFRKAVLSSWMPGMLKKTLLEGM